MLPQTANDDRQQCDPPVVAAAAVAAVDDDVTNLDDDDDGKGRNLLPLSPHHSSANEHFNFNHQSSSSRSRKRRTSTSTPSSNEAVFLSISPTSPSHHYFSSCSTAEDSIISSSPTIPHSSLRSVPPRSGGYAASPNAYTPRTGACEFGVGMGDEIRRNSALETSQDKIDNNSYGAWWFFSNSDSFGFGNTPEKKPPQQQKSPPPPPPPPPPPMPGTIDENNGRMHQAENATIVTSPTMSNFEEDMRSDGWMDQINATTAPKATTTSGESGVWEVAPTTDDDGGRKSTTDNAKLNAASEPPPNAPVMGGNYTFKEQKMRTQNESWALSHNIDATLSNVGGGGESGTILFNNNYSSDGFISSSAGAYVPPPYNDQSSMMPVSLSIGNADEDDWDMTMAANYERRRKQDSIVWTPPDSSYGAAIPACGWIPKRVRKSLEVVFFALSVALLIFVLVKAGLELRSGGSGTTTTSSSSSSGSASETDDFSEYIRNDDHVNENAGNNAGNVNGNGRNNYRLVRI